MWDKRLSTSLGPIKLKNPFLIGAGPASMYLDDIKRAEEENAGGVISKSIGAHNSNESIKPTDIRRYKWIRGYGNYLKSTYLKEILPMDYGMRLIENAKSQCDIPMNSQGNTVEQGLQNIADANVQVEVSSGFAGLVVEQDLHQEIRAKFTQIDYQTRLDPYVGSIKSDPKITVVADNLSFLAREMTITGTTYYYKIDKLSNEMLSGNIYKTDRRKYALPVRVQLAMNTVSQTETKGTTNTENKTSVESADKNKQPEITQYQWFFPAPTLAAERKPQPTNKEPKFIIGEDEDYWMRDPVQEDTSVN